MTKDEAIAKAMLLDMDFVDVGYKGFLLRKRTGAGSFAGMALFTYYDADTLNPVKGLIDRSELDSDRRNTSTTRSGSD